MSEKLDRAQQAIAAIQAGETAASIARRLSLNRSTVSRWEARYNADGSPLKRGTVGAPSKLEPSDWEEVMQIVRGSSRPFGERGPWVAREIGMLIFEVYGVQFDRNHLRRKMRSLGIEVGRERQKIAVSRNSEVRFDLDPLRSNAQRFAKYARELRSLLTSENALDNELTKIAAGLFERKTIGLYVGESPFDDMEKSIKAIDTVVSDRRNLLALISKLPGIYAANDTPRLKGTRLLAVMDDILANHAIATTRHWRIKIEAAKKNGVLVATSRSPQACPPRPPA